MGIPVHFFCIISSSIHPSLHRYICTSDGLSIHPSIHPSACLSVCLPVCLSVCVCVSVCLLVCLSVCLSLCTICRMSVSIIHMFAHLCVHPSVFVHLCVHLSLCPSVSICMPIHLCLSVCVFIPLCDYLSVCLSASLCCLSVPLYLCVCLAVYPFSCVFVCPSTHPPFPRSLSGTHHSLHSTGAGSCWSSRGGGSCSVWCRQHRGNGRAAGCPLTCLPAHILSSNCISLCVVCTCTNNIHKPQRTANSSANIPSSWFTIIHRVGTREAPVAGIHPYFA